MNNAGSIAARSGDLVLQANGTITATNQLTLDAGRDINSNSTLTSAKSSAGYSTVTNTTVDRVAGLYVTGEAGILLASAGRDINLIASTVNNSSGNVDQGGQTMLGAQRNINLGTLQTSQTNNLERDSGNYRRATSTAETGTTIQTPGSIRLDAGNDINARAAQLSAGKALDATAGTQR